MPNYRKVELFQLHTLYFMKKTWTFKANNLKKILARYVEFVKESKEITTYGVAFARTTPSVVNSL